MATISQPVTAQGIPEHVELTGVALDQVRLAYVPVPKAASTSILAALAEIRGLGPERRARSRKLEAIRSTTVHDGSLWDREDRLRWKSSWELEWILHSDEWFRFTVVREPAQRLWSGWVTKVLVRDPRFVVSFGEDWFPPVPSSAVDVLESFREFVTELPGNPDSIDSHWSSQADLAGVSRIPYDHVGRVEQLEQTEQAIGTYLGRRGVTLPRLRAENRSFLPFSPGVFDHAAHDACMRWIDVDCEAFGYEPLPYAGGQPSEEWFARVDAAVPALRAVIERNERILDVWRAQHDAESRPPQLPRTAYLAAGFAAAASLSALLAITRSS